jgi:hypothetical protein
VSYRADVAIDLVIAVHDPARPLQRALDSVLSRDTTGRLRVTVVCHNVAEAAVTVRLDPATRGAVRFLEWNDGIPSPAGPFNHGLAQATARYVSIMGSDDFLEPGALAAWLAMAERMTLTAVIAPQRHAAGARVRTPFVRPWRRARLDGVRDRLAYRTAPLGLFRREAIDRLGLLLTPGLPTGEDQLFGLKLWFSDARLGYGRGLPNYVVGDGARSRASLTVRPISEELAFIDVVLADPWFGTLGVRQRRSIVTKWVRVHFFSLAGRRCESGTWTRADREQVATLLSRLGRAAPGFQWPFALADRRLLDGLLDADVSAEALGRAARARRRFGAPSTLVARDIRGQFAVEGPLRFMAASALL